MFGKRLAQERQRVGLSQRELAERLGLGRSALGMIETDRSAIVLERLIAVGDLGFDVQYILSGEPSPVAAARLLNWELLGAILAGVREWTQKREISLPPDKEMLILKLLYEHFAERGMVDDDAISRALQFAA